MSKTLNISSAIDIEYPVIVTESKILTESDFGNLICNISSNITITINNLPPTSAGWRIKISNVSQSNIATSDAGNVLIEMPSPYPEIVLEKGQSIYLYWDGIEFIVLEYRGGKSKDEIALYTNQDIVKESGVWTAPVNGYYRVTCIGAGGGGGKGGNNSLGGSGGSKGGNTTFIFESTTITAEGGSGGGGGGTLSSGGGGSAGNKKTGYLYMYSGQRADIVIGMGGSGSRVMSTTESGEAGEGTYAGQGGSPLSGGIGAAGAGNGQGCMTAVIGSVIGGPGGSNGTRYGAGGGGGGAGNQQTTYNGGSSLSRNGDNCYSPYISGSGGNGGDGAVMIEYKRIEE